MVESTGVLSVHREGELWRWLHEERGPHGAPQRLWSSIAFADRESAVEAARTAYPEAVLAEPPPPRGRGRRLAVAAATIAVLLVLRARRGRERRVTTSPGRPRA